MLSSVKEEFVSTIVSAKSLSFKNLKGQLLVYVTVFVFVFLSIILMFVAHWLDEKSAEEEDRLTGVSLWKAQRHKTKKEAGMTRALMAMTVSNPMKKRNTKVHVIDTETNADETAVTVAPSPDAGAGAADGAAEWGSLMKKKEKKTSENMHTEEIKTPLEAIEKSIKAVDNSLPDILGSSTLPHKIWMEQYKNNKWLSVWTFHRPNYPRALRLLANITDVSILFFADALLVNLKNPDDGSCTGLNSESTCLEEESTYMAGETKCIWGSDLGGNPYCTYNEPEASNKIILFILIMSVLLSLPLQKLNEWLMENYIALPTDVGENESESDKKSDATVAPLSGSSANPLFDGISAEDEVLEILKGLTSKLKAHSQSLNGDEKVEFDEIWGLDPASGNFSLRNPGPGFSVGSSVDMKLFWQELLSYKKSAQKYTTEEAVMLEKSLSEQRCLDELKKVDDICKQELEFFKANGANDHMIGKRLLFLLQCDLLPGQQGSILRVKDEGDYFMSEYANYTLKMSAWVFIVLLNLFCIFYVLLFASGSSKESQKSWFIALMIWLAADIFLTSTFATLVQHVLLPSSITADVDKVKVSTMKEIYNLEMEQARENAALAKGEDYQREEPSSINEFNATEYLFVSQKIALKYPHLMESKLIRRFHTPYPRHAYHSIHQTMSLRNVAWKTFSILLNAVLMFIFLALFWFPTTVLEGVIELGVHTVFGSLVIFFVSLDSAVYTTLFVLGVVAIIALIYYGVLLLSRARQDRLKQQIRESSGGAVSKGRNSSRKSPRDPEAPSLVAADSKKVFPEG